MADGQQGTAGGTTDRGGSTPGLSPNDDRAIVKNPNNPAHGADAANRQRQKSGS
ncbi:MAG TPA: hypothetical protein VF665_24275 [Longimicrobium sp.]|jgi:hypothetical protein|uniref:hypothetical protein n=1 Tax=Longimicrobium sp. TaxID=2029185 RepID=UPI002EDA0D4B